MPLFGKTEPGHEAFRVCPECEMDEIYSKSRGILNGTEYICDNCGYIAEKHEVRRNANKMYSEIKKRRTDELSSGDEGGNSQNTGELLDLVSDPELEQQVVDRKAEGWKIDEISDSGERVIMSSTEGGTIGGHALTGVLTGLWTFGMGNVAYDKLSERKNEDVIVLRTNNKSNSVAQIDNPENKIDLIRDLKKLNEEGLITDDEFEEKRKELLEEV